MMHGRTLNASRLAILATLVVAGSAVAGAQAKKPGGASDVRAVAIRAAAVSKLLMRAIMMTLLTAVCAAAQQGTDFSGRWTLIGPADAAPDTAQTMTIRQPIVRTDVYGRPMTPFYRELIVNRETADGVRSETYGIGLEWGIVGGLPRPEAEPDTRGSTTWDGDRLVIERTRYLGPAHDTSRYTTHKEVWRLDGTGRLVIEITDGASGADSQTVTLTYQRKEA